MKRTTIKNAINTFIAFFIGLYSFGQVTIPGKEDKESFEKLEEGIIRREIATFTIAGSFGEEADSLLKPKLTEVPLLGCSDDFISFEAGNWVSAQLHVTINSTPFDPEKNKITYLDSAHQWVGKINDLPIWGTDGNMPKNQIVNVEYWFNIHNPLKLPASALEDLYEPNFCSENYSSPGKKPTPPKVFSRVYCSEDKKRVYIYMLNSDGAGGYEVTWVIEDGDYLKRVIDYGF